MFISGHFQHGCAQWKDVLESRWMKFLHVYAFAVCLCLYTKVILWQNNLLPCFCENFRSRASVVDLQATPASNSEADCKIQVTKLKSRDGPAAGKMLKTYLNTRCTPSQALATKPNLRKLKHWDRAKICTGSRFRSGSRCSPGHWTPNTSDTPDTVTPQLAGSQTTLECPLHPVLSNFALMDGGMAFSIPTIWLLLTLLPHLKTRFFWREHRLMDT